MKVPLAPFIRIGLRYAGAALVAKGMLTPDEGNALATDAELVSALEIASGLALAGIAEVWHAVVIRRKAQ
jgi:hypothetical protein